jgi:acetylornithine aminotransferase
MPFITSYQPQDVCFNRGEGLWLWDDKGKQYLDALSGIAVTGLGHCHPKVVAALKAQAETLWHTSNVYRITHQEALSEKLCQLTGMQQLFMANSGAEANEAAIKLARLYGHQKGIETPSIIVMEHAFHGRTMATLTASANRKGQAGFEPLVPGFVRAPMNDIGALATISENRDDVIAVMLEPIQGEGGIHLSDPNYLSELRTLCDQQGWLLILDEIQTGVGRTGSLYQYQQSGITPDVLTTAKGLGNGFPVAACLMSGPACNLFQPGNHGSTFGGNPLAMKVALTTLDVIEEEGLIDNAKKQGAFLQDLLRETFSSYQEVTEVRGQGLMIGIELDRPARAAVKLGLEEGVLFNVTAEKVIRLLPPLIINQDECIELAKRLEKTLTRFFNHAK